MDKIQYMLAIEAICAFRKCTKREAISILMLGRDCSKESKIDAAFRAGVRDGQARALAEASVVLHDHYIAAQKHADDNR